jgi:four helix bundle protein
VEDKIADLKQRTRKFALRIIRLSCTLPKSRTGAVIAGQILRCGTSVGAQYAEATHAKSRNDFLSKIVGATQELEETLYWLDLAVEADLVSLQRTRLLRQEATELMAIFISMAKRTKERSASA